jgi:hypothetical protein
MARFEVISQYLLWGTEESYEMPVRLGSLQAEVWTQSLPDVKQSCYPLDPSVWLCLWLLWKVVHFLNLWCLMSGIPAKQCHAHNAKLRCRWRPLDGLLAQFSFKFQSLARYTQHLILEPTGLLSTRLCDLFLYVVHVFTSYKKKSCSMKPGSIKFKEKDENCRMLIQRI